MTINPQNGQDFSSMHMETRQKIMQHGWTGIGVISTDALPDYVYSIGLSQTLGTPEFIVIGPRVQEAYRWLEALAGGVAVDRQTTSARELRKEFDAEKQMRPLPEAAKKQMMLAMATHYPGRPFDALQFCFPDEAGRLPDDPLCDPRFVAVQDPLAFLGRD